MCSSADHAAGAPRSTPTCAPRTRRSKTMCLSRGNVDAGLSLIGWTGSADPKRPRRSHSRNDDRHAGKGTSIAFPRSARTWAMPKMAMQMTAPWKPQNGFHRALEISQRTRDFHIRTAKTRFGEREKNRRPEDNDSITSAPQAEHDDVVVAP